MVLLHVGLARHRTALLQITEHICIEARLVQLRSANALRRATADYVVDQRLEVLAVKLVHVPFRSPPQPEAPGWGHYTPLLPPLGKTLGKRAITPKVARFLSAAA